MAAKLYKTAEQVSEAIKNKNVKRNSVLVMKRQAKQRQDYAYEQILSKGVSLYDDSRNDVLYCSYYNKPINSLSLYDLVTLEKDHPELFTHYHKVKYSMLMLGEVGDIQSYKGNIITPNDLRSM